MYRIELLDSMFEINSFCRNIFKTLDTSSLTPPINKTQERVLMGIARGGSLIMSEISCRFGLEKGSFTQVADSLEALELVRRVRSEQDRRMIILEITEKGKRYANRLHGLLQKHTDVLFDRLNEEQKAELLRSLGKASEYIRIMHREERNHA